MKHEEKIIREIRKYWFKNHKAILTKHGDLEILDWRKPGTNNYAVRYVFDGYRMYISGDIGEAVFNLTWEATLNSFKGININYFVEKMGSGEKEIWNSEEAEKSLLEWKNERLEYTDDYFKNKTEQTEFEVLVDDLIDAVNECSSIEQWAWEYVNERYNDEISKFDNDYWEWMYDIGSVVPHRTYGFLIGLQMAAEQLKG